MTSAYISSNSDAFIHRITRYNLVKTNFNLPLKISNFVINAKYIISILTFAAKLMFLREWRNEVNYNEKTEMTQPLFVK